VVTGAALGIDEVFSGRRHVIRVRKNPCLSRASMRPIADGRRGYAG
jgi:hypothetical protein